MLHEFFWGDFSPLDSYALEYYYLVLETIFKKLLFEFESITVWRFCCYTFCHCQKSVGKSILTWRSISISSSSWWQLTKLGRRRRWWWRIKELVASIQKEVNMNASNQLGILVCQSDHEKLLWQIKNTCSSLEDNGKKIW